MAYIKKDWVGSENPLVGEPGSTPITEEALDHLETQYDEAVAYTDEAVEGVVAQVAEVAEAVAVLERSAVEFGDRGEMLVSRLSLGAGDITVGIAGDSTGNAPNEHADLWAAAVGAANPSLRVEIPHWDDVTQAYSAPVVVQAGEPQPTGIVFRDTFSRTAADLFSTTPDIGLAWGRDGSNAVGDWALDGAGAVRTADVTAGAMLGDSGVTGDQTVTISGTFSATARPSASTVRFYFHYASPNDHLYLQVAVSTTGITTLSLAKRVENVATTLQTAGGGFSTGGASQPFTVTLAKDGLNVTAQVNGVTLTGGLSEAESDALASGTKAGFSGGGFVPGDRVNRVEVALLGEAAPLRSFTLYNASMSGSTLAYQQSRLAAMFPEPLDVLFVSSCHNYGAQTPAQYWAALDSFLTAFKAVRPEAGIVIMSQNPQKPPATNRVPHLERLASLRSYAARRGYGYVPVIEAFAAQPDGGISLVNSDGIHPTGGAVGSGSSLWRDATIDYLDRLSAE